MGNVKTAISLEKSLFEQAENLAHELNMSRSRLLALALEAFISRYENQQLLERINRAYDDAPTSAEQTLQRSMRQQQRRIVEGEW